MKNNNSSDKSNGLFARVLAEYNNYIMEQKSQSGRDVMTFPASQVTRLGQVLFSNLSDGGFCTLIVSGRRDWDPHSHYYKTVRSAARRGLEIQRAFLLPHKHSRHDKTLQEHVKLDKDAGIRVSLLYVGELIATSALPFVESLEFGIWDNVVGCVSAYGSSGLASGVVEWRVTSRSEDLQSLNEIKNILLRSATNIPLEDKKVEEKLDLEEPMITTAAIAHQLAGVLCQGDHVSPEDCSWYHSVWQYLRIFNMVSTQTWHEEFYLNALRKLAAQKESCKVLISGTADYSMLAHVLWGFNEAPSAPDVTVVDLCETPLFLCKWYGKSTRTRITTVAADILKFGINNSFDLIATDAFLTRFSPDERKQVINRWFELLRPGGYVLTSVRIEPGLSGLSIQATPEQIKEFRCKALLEARRWQGFLPSSAEEIANLAEQYAKRMTSYSFNSENELRSLLLGAGFIIERIELAEVPGEMESTIYAEVLALRP